MKKEIKVIYRRLNSICGAQIEVGGSTDPFTICWKCENSNECSISNNKTVDCSSLTGKATLTTGSNTTYTLTGINEAFREADSVSIMIACPPSCLPCPKCYRCSCGECHPIPRCE